MELDLLKLLNGPFYIDKNTKVPLEGETINNYHLIAQISSTTSSFVFITEFLEDHKKKVIKFIKRKEENLEAIKNEILITQTVSNLNNIRLITVESIFPYREFICIVEPFAKFGNLENEILKRYQKGVISEDLASSVMKQMLEAVRCLHYNKIIHRDIKLQNFFVYESDNDNIKIVLGDFGISEYFQKDKKVFTSGSHDYAAPELIRGSPADYTIDIWALGICLFIILAGTYPFPKFSSHKNICKNAILSGELNFWIMCGRSFESIELIKNMCAYQSNERISIDSALQNVWITKYQKDSAEGKSVYNFVYTDSEIQ